MIDENEKRFMEIADNLCYSLNDGQIQALGLLLLNSGDHAIAVLEDAVTEHLHELSGLLHQRANVEGFVAETTNSFGRVKSLMAEIKFVDEIYDGGINWDYYKDLEHELPMKKEKTLPDL